MCSALFGPVSLVVARKPNHSVQGDPIYPVSVKIAEYPGKLLYSYAEFRLCQEIDIWVEVKPQAVAGGTAIRFNSLNV